MTGNGSNRDPYAWMVAELRSEVTEQLAEHGRAENGCLAMGPDERRTLGWKLTRDALRHRAEQSLAAGRGLLDGTVEQYVARRVVDDLCGLGGFQALLDDPDIENINANGCDRVRIRYADGTNADAPPVAASDEELIELVRTAAAHLGVSERRFDFASPMLSMQLPDGSRLTAVMSVCARPSVAIRRHRYMRTGLAELTRLGTLSPVLAKFLRAAVRARKNLLISGGTGIGKTTLLRALAAEIDPDERLVTIEDARELALDDDEDAHRDVVAFETREPNIEEAGEITLAQLVRLGLRMSPDRVIVGEVRGSEVVPMLNAMSQGNDGSLATVHASSSEVAFSKLAAYAIQSAERLPMEATALLIASAVHLVVHLDSDRTGRRVVSSVREVEGFDGTSVVSNEVFRPGPDRQAIPGVPLRTTTALELEAAGFDLDLLLSGEGGEIP